MEEVTFMYKFMIGRRDLILRKLNSQNLPLRNMNVILIERCLNDQNLLHIDE